MGVKSTGSHPTTTKADGHLLEYFRNTMGAGGGANAGPAGFIEMEASGGVITDYESGGTQYRTHTFTTSGTFQITQMFSPFEPFPAFHSLHSTTTTSLCHRGG